MDQTSLLIGLVVGIVICLIGVKAYQYYYGSIKLLEGPTGISSFVEHGSNRYGKWR